MKYYIGIFLIVLGIFLGLYVGLYLCFVGGIIQIVKAIQAEPILASQLAWGVVKITFAGVAGWASCLFCIFPAFVIMDRK